MERLIALALLALAACGAEEWVTYENKHFGYTLEIPSDFEVRERLIHTIGGSERDYDYQVINLTAWDRDPRPVVEVGVNGYEYPLAEDTLYVFYDFMITEDGSVERVGHRLEVPEDGYNSVRTYSAFTDPATQNTYSFDMEIWNDQEQLFVDIVSSFRLKKNTP